MLNQLIRYYNQNRKTVIGIAIFVALFLILYRYLVYSYRKNIMLPQNEVNNNQYTNSSISNLQENNNSQIVDENTTVYPNNNAINNDSNAKQKTTINKFIEVCNNGNIEEAYNLLTDDCKEVLFPNINIFTENYYKKIFTGKVTAKIESSIYSGIYEVTYYKDILANGGSGNNKEKDYIYYEEQNGQAKLSVNQFLYKQNINKNVTKDNVNIKIISKQIYMDYEIYQIQIVNNSNNTVLVDSKEKNDTVCLLDDNNLKYFSNISEINNNRLIIKPDFAVVLDLKFNKIYNSGRIAKSIQFLDIIKNYEEYINGQEKQNIQIGISVE